MRPDASSELDAAIARGLDKNPAQRFASVRAFVDAAFVRPEQGTSHTEASPRSRRPLLAVLAAVLVLAALVLAAVVGWRRTVDLYVYAASIRGADDESIRFH